MTTAFVGSDLRLNNMTGILQQFTVFLVFGRSDYPVQSV